MITDQQTAVVPENELDLFAYPSENSFKSIWLKSRFFVLSKVYKSTFAHIKALTGNSLFHTAVESKPRILEKALKPYLYVDIKPMQRMRHIEEHFSLLSDTFGNSIEGAFKEDGLTLLSLEDSKGSSYSIILFDGEMREGSLGLRIINDLGQTIYSITFNLSTSPVKTMHIGALKGPSEQIEDRNQVIKTLTRSFHGLRPKALMVELALIFGKSIGVQEFVGVSNKGHIYQALRYKGSKNKAVTFDYDELWAEYGAVQCDKYRYDIPAFPERKDPSALKKNKRRLYTKRYAWLDELELDLSNKINALKTETIELG
ncbi:VirK/YbjX family protein [Vibrio superstes]|uniref:Membrane protein n=1 Tax=Vibrio superstes NBRC 103154 TaxID=1219062 RepID=A0A511QVE1_9VIBR|nr:VirK/YbjX family protein [Vibrio superstes]GEM81339.1 membrane protein [Vibrio superstes NBRC 103154]